jgi:HSP20 family molecular chaperone IbpA
VPQARKRPLETAQADPLDSGQVSAELAHGVLRLRIPKAEHAQPKRIEVRVS